MLEYECAGMGEFELEYVCRYCGAVASIADDLEVEVVVGEEVEYFVDV